MLALYFGLPSYWITPLRVPGTLDLGAQIVIPEESILHNKILMITMSEKIGKIDALEDEKIIVLKFLSVKTTNRCSIRCNYQIFALR